VGRGLAGQRLEKCLNRVGIGRNIRPLIA